MITYLNNGGNLYISSVDIGSSLKDRELFTYFGINFIDEGPNYSIRYMEANNSSLMNNSYFPYKGGLDPHVNIDNVETATAEVLYTSEDGKPRIFLNATESYNVITSTIIFGALRDNDSLNLKTYFMAEMIDYLKTNSSLGIQKDMSIDASTNAYPNPARNEVNISFNLKNQEFVEINIYDLNGSLVKQLVSTALPEGQHTFNWNLQKTNNQRVNAGIYFYEVNTPINTFSSRIVIL